MLIKKMGKYLEVAIHNPVDCFYRKRGKLLYRRKNRAKKVELGTKVKETRTQAARGEEKS